VAKFVAAVLVQRKVTKLVSREHFSVDGTLIETLAFMRRFKLEHGGADPMAPTTGLRKA
jgi:hypothetical protein